LLRSAPTNTISQAQPATGCGHGYTGDTNPKGAFSIAMRPMLLLALSLAAAAPPAAPDPVGRYRLTGEQDVASQLIVSRDGSFEYALAAGALDEYAKGRWTRAGRQIRLTTVPKPVPPSFAPGTAKKTSEAPLVLHILWPNGRDAVGTDLKVEFETGDPLDTYVGGPDRWTMPEGETRRPVAVTLALGMFGFGSGRFAIDAAKANDLTFVITPHDLGKVDFESVPVDVERGRLVMHRGPARMVYVKTR
jgi:hypothetical protein